jgi:signal transduction histidine kinase
VSSRPGTSGLEFLGTLAGGLVHEIKNPLSTLRINLTLLKEDLEAALPHDRKMKHRIEVLEKEVGRLDGILDDFMRYAGMRRFDLEPHDLAAVVGELAEFVRPSLARDGVRLVTDVPSLPLRLDAPLFKQALLNLLLNAQQAIAGQGTVRVTAGREADGVRLEVADDGCGIPQGMQDQVFDVYFSGSKAGSGLGLPTARRIVEEHGGSLALESNEGGGTRVVLRLPVP